MSRALRGWMQKASTCGNERLAVRSTLTRCGQDVGWTHLPSEEHLRLRGADIGLLLHVLTGQLQRLNPSVVDASGTEAMATVLARVPTTIAGSVQPYELLDVVELEAVIDAAI